MRERGEWPGRESVAITAVFDGVSGQWMISC